MHLKCLLSEYSYYEIIIGKVHVSNHALNVHNMHNVSNIDNYVYCYIVVVTTIKYIIPTMGSVMCDVTLVKERSKRNTLMRVKN